MILILHITIALLSLVATGILYFFPSRPKLRLSYALVALTLFTGFYLVLSLPASLTQACASGLVYLGIVSYGIVSARNRLTKIPITD